MRVTAQLFARLREAAGQEYWTVDVAEGATVRDVWQRLVAERPDLKGFTRIVSCAVNMDFATFDTAVQANDELAFLPPVSGGDS
jgi:molybdopterin converting factor subunit 1